MAPSDYLARPVIKTSQRLSTKALTYLLPLAFAGGLLATESFAEGNESGFSYVATAPPQVSVGSWGPVPGVGVSIANTAPVVLPFLNNGPVFGLPGTVVGDFWQRTQVTGDWGGLRTDLARQGLFFDLYTTSAYQAVTSGGIKANDSFVQNAQLSVNIDTARARLWQGGLIHVTVQSRYGDLPNETFTAGTFVPHYMGLAHPDPTLANDTLPTEFYLVQSVTKELFVVVGRISTIFIPDQTLFGDSYKYYFANFNFNLNPMTTNSFGPVALTSKVTWVPNKSFAVVAGVLDPFGRADNLAKNAFESQNYYVQSVVSYQPGGLPGQFSLAYNWTNKALINLGSPFGMLLPGQDEQAIGALLGALKRAWQSTLTGIAGS
jgi:porin